MKLGFVSLCWPLSLPSCRQKTKGDEIFHLYLCKMSIEDLSPGVWSSLIYFIKQIYVLVKKLLNSNPGPGPSHIGAFKSQQAWIICPGEGAAWELETGSVPSHISSWSLPFFSILGRACHILFTFPVLSEFFSSLLSSSFFSPSHPFFCVFLLLA